MEHSPASSAAIARSPTIAALCIAQLLMVATNLGRLPVGMLPGERTVPILLSDVCVGVVLLIAILESAMRRRLRLDDVALAGLAFAFVGFASALWSVQRFGLSIFELTVSLAYLARWVFYFTLYLAVSNLARREDVESIWSSIETMLVVLVIFGIAQSLFLPGFGQMVETLSGQTWDRQGNRLVSTVLDPNFAGAMIMIGLLIQLARLSTGGRVSRISILVMFVGLILTLSRSAVLAFFIGCVVILLARGLSKRLMALGAVISVLVLVALPGIITYANAYSKFNFDTSEGTDVGVRFTEWLRALTVFSDHPTLGVGYNTYAFVLERYGFDIIRQNYGADGGLIFLLALTGVVGVTVYCLGLALVIRRSRRIWRDERRTPNERGIAIGAAAITVAMVVDSLFVSSLLVPFIMELLWVIWALLAVIDRSVAESVALEKAAIPEISTPSPRLISWSLS